MKLETERLILRHWKKSDLEIFAQMNADSAVMEYFPNTLSVDESNLLANKIIGFIEENGYGLMALELKSNGRFIGFTGLCKPNFDAHFTYRFFVISSVIFFASANNIKVFSL